jgi:hypothetical protein
MGRGKDRARGRARRYTHTHMQAPVDAFARAAILSVTLAYTATCVAYIGVCMCRGSAVIYICK